MRKLLLSLLSMCSTVACTWAASWSSVSPLGDTTGDTRINAMQSYRDSLVLMVGSFSGRTLEYGAIKLSNEGRSDAFVALANQQGEWVWAHSIGGAGDDVATAVTSDAAGNIYVCGHFGSLSLRFGATTLSNQGDLDAFLLKFSANRAPEWIQGFATSFTEEAFGVATDRDGNVYVGGHYINSLSNPNERVFIAKVSPSKSLLWQRFGTNTNGSVYATGMALTDNGDVFLCGALSGRLSFGTGQQIQSGSGSNGFIIRYSAAGTWQNGVVNGSVDRWNAIAASGNDVFVCGEKLNYGIGWGWPLSDSKIHTAAYNSTLVKRWEKATGGLVTLVSLDIGTAITAGSGDDVYVTGKFQGRVIAFAGDSIFNTINKDYFYEQAFVLNYAKDGREKAIHGLGGSLNDAGTAVLPTTDGFILAGQYESDSIQIGTHTLFNNGLLREIYVHLRPVRYGRNAKAFLARFGTLSSSSGNELKVQSKVFPNPVTDQLHVQWQADAPLGALTLSVFSMDGKMISQEIVSSETNMHLLKMTDFVPGMYLIQFEGLGYRILHRVLKK